MWGSMHTGVWLEFEVSSSLWYINLVDRGQK